MIKPETLAFLTALVENNNREWFALNKDRYEVAKTDVLTFSYIGYKTTELTIGNNTILNVTLFADASTLNEVVVTAYGIDRDVKSLGYSTPKVSGDEAAATQRNDFFGSLQGRVPGLSINSTNGNPGSSAQIV